jgi:hypothetical protein
MRKRRGKEGEKRRKRGEKRGNEKLKTKNQ